MKRPEYVAIVTGVYSRALKQGREPTKEELEQLQQVFSRQGFTDGYFLDQKGSEMFGIRQEEEVPRELYAQARATYENGENRKEPVRLYAVLEAGQPARVAAQDKDGRIAHVEGPVPEAARNVPLTVEKVEGQLSRTGGTPYLCEKTTIKVEEGLSLPLSTLNQLRRQVLDALSEQRKLPPERRSNPYHAGVRYENQKQPPKITVSVRLAEQISNELLDLKPALLYIPVEECVLHPEVLEQCKGAEVPVAVILPRICWDREQENLEQQLLRLKEKGITQVLAGTLGMAQMAFRLGFEVRGDYGLGIYNSQTMKEVKRLGFRSATISFEMKFPQIRDVSKTIPTEFIAYGRLPLMITENCIVYNHYGQHTCGQVKMLTDRKGEQFPVVKAWGCRNEILNSKRLFLADKPADWSKLGMWAARLMFTTEDAFECARILERYMGKGRFYPKEYTRGLYYRDVE